MKMKSEMVGVMGIFLRMFGVIACATVMATANAMTTGAGIILAGAAGGIGNGEMSQRAAVQAVPQSNPALAVIEFDAAKRALRNDDVDAAYADLHEAAQHDPDGTFAGGSVGVKQFIRSLDAQRCHDTAAASQEEQLWNDLSPARFFSVEALPEGLLMLYALALCIRRKGCYGICRSSHS